MNLERSLKFLSSCLSCFEWNLLIFSYSTLKWVPSHLPIGLFNHNQHFKFKVRYSIICQLPDMKIKSASDEEIDSMIYLIANDGQNYAGTGLLILRMSFLTSHPCFKEMVICLSLAILQMMKGKMESPHLWRILKFGWIFLMIYYIWCVYILSKKYEICLFMVFDFKI